MFSPKDQIAIERPEPSSSPNAGRGRALKIGVLDLLSDAAPQSFGERMYGSHFRKQFTSITPQAVSVWCRQMGHTVAYATYHGHEAPHTLIPDDVDVLFLCAYTKAAPLAYALAKWFKGHGALTVLGGAHARSFPDDALRFFDWVVGDCDRQLIEDLLAGHYPRATAISSGRTLEDFPSVEERLPELRASSLSEKGRTFWQAVPLLASVGCPYTCDFCVDWNSRYVRLPSEHLRRDLEFLADNYPKVIVGYHDPNFAVQFDQTMDVLESIEPERRLPYVMESSLSVLKESRMQRLKDTRCAYAVAGIESWQEYSGKAGTGRANGRKKLEAVTAQFDKLKHFVNGFQGNFVLGTDADSGRDPAELTREFIRRNPHVWPGINIPTPFGGTPLFDDLLDSDRVLRELPFLFYYNPYLVFVPKHYGVIEYYDLLIEVFAEMNTAGSWRRRLGNGTHWLVKAIHSVQAAGAWSEIKEFKRIRQMLASDANFLAFHERRSDRLPDFYHQRFEQRLGRYAELLEPDERRPHFETDASLKIEWQREGDVQMHSGPGGPDPLPTRLSEPELVQLAPA